MSENRPMFFCRARTITSVIATLLLTTSTIDAQAQNLPSDASFAIVGVNVIPMDEDRVLENQTIVVRRGVIHTLGDSGEVHVPDGTRTIDGEGQFLIPGLADMHVHILNEDDFVNYLTWGVTTVMHMGGSGLPGTELLQHRHNILAGSTPGPNIYTTNRMFDGEPRLSDRSIELTNPDDARVEVRNLKDDGFDFIKIYNNVSQPVFEAITDEGRKQGLPVFGHIPRKFDALAALSGGQNAIAHTEELFFSYFDGPRDTLDMTAIYEPDMDKLAPLTQILIENNVATMPDLSFTFTDLIMWDDLDILWNDSEYAYLHPATASMWQAANINRRSNIENFVVREQWKYELILKLTKHFQDAGVLQVIGTDASIPGLFAGKAAHRELTELVKAGLSNFEALAIGTRNAGEFARRYLDDNVRFGQVTPGYRADLVLLENNPLEDIRNARTVSGVAVAGKYLSKSEIDDKRELLRTRYARLNSINEEIDVAINEPDATAKIQALIDENGVDTEFLITIEARINAAGYAAAIAGDLKRAEDILSTNTDVFPNSANTWDSLAEIKSYLGDEESALTYYRKALEVDPEFSHAAEQIEKIQSETGN